jgi:hypothetical protein
VDVPCDMVVGWLWGSIAATQSGRNKKTVHQVCRFGEENAQSFSLSFRPCHAPPECGSFCISDVERLAEKNGLWRVSVTYASKVVTVCQAVNRALKCMPGTLFRSAAPWDFSSSMQSSSLDHNQGFNRRF